MSTMKEKLHTGELYLPGDDEIVEIQTKRLDRLYDYNMTRPTEGEKRTEMLTEMFAEIGEFSGEGFEEGFSASMGTAFKDAKKEMQAGINGLDAAVSVTGAPARAAQAWQSSPSLSYGGFTVNVYAAEGQDEKAIADRVAAKLQTMISCKEAVFA